jgi:hypothetical protein
VTRGGIEAVGEQQLACLCRQGFERGWGLGRETHLTACLHRTWLPRPCLWHLRQVAI